MYEIAYILVIGAVAGIIHQLMDRAKENDTKAYIRGAIIGAVSGWLITLVYSIQDQNILYLSVFVAGYTGDSIILNIVERYANNNDDEGVIRPPRPQPIINSSESAVSEEDKEVSEIVQNL